MTGEIIEGEKRRTQMGTQCMSCPTCTRTRKVNSTTHPRQPLFSSGSRSGFDQFDENFQSITFEAGVWAGFGNTYRPMCGLNNAWCFYESPRVQCGYKVHSLHYINSTIVVSFLHNSSELLTKCCKSTVDLVLEKLSQEKERGRAREHKWHDIKL